MNYNDGTCCSDPEKSTIIQLVVLFTFSFFIGISISIYIYNKVFKKTRSSYKRYKWTKLHSKVEDDLELMELSDANANLIAENGEANDDEIVQFESLSTSKERLTDLEQGLSKNDLLILLSRLGVVMFYFYLCDRTNYFMKENKYFTRPNFFLPIAYVFALGLFFTDESATNTVLHRDQTNEMKGWMQLVILGLFLLI